MLGLFDCSFGGVFSAAEGDGVGSGGGAGAGENGGGSASLLAGAAGDVGGSDGGAGAVGEGGVNDDVGVGGVGAGEGGLVYDAESEDWRRAVGCVGEMDEGYVPVRPDGVPEVAWDGEAVREAAAEAHRLGMPAKMFEGIVGFMAAKSAAVKEGELQRQAEGVKEAEVSLRKVWGDGYVAELKGAGWLIESVGAKVGLSAEEVNGLIEGDVGSNAALLRVLAFVAGERKEDGGGGFFGGGSGVGGQGARAEMAAMMKPGHRLYDAFNNPQHPDWKDANDYYNRLSASAGKGF